MTIRRNGITYDTGFINAGVSTRESFDPEIVKREMRIIHDDLHCTAVRITGGDPDRLEIAATRAAEAGLEVWFSPFPCDLTTGELLEPLADCVERAERLRQQGADVVLLTGSELSLSTIGFLPSDTIKDRLELLTAPHRLREVIAEVPARINDFLGKAVGVVRERFGGKITATPRSRWRGSTGHPSTSSRPTPAIARSRSPTGIATASVPSSHRGSRWRSPSSGAPPTGAPPIWAALVTRWSKGATTAGRSG